MYLWLKHSISIKDLEKKTRWNSEKGRYKRLKLCHEKVFIILFLLRFIEKLLQDQTSAAESLTIHEAPYMMKCPADGCNREYSDFQVYKDHVMKHLTKRIKTEKPEQTFD